MKSQFKTPEQVEFTDLARELKEKFKFSQNKIAAIAHLGPSAVSMILRGERSPGAAALELLRRECQMLTEPAPPGQVKKEPDELKEQIDFLKYHSPSGYAAAKATVGALHKHAISSKKATDPAAVAAAVIEELVDLAEGPKNKPKRPSRKAAPPKSGVAREKGL